MARKPNMPPIQRTLVYDIILKLGAENKPKAHRISVADVETLKAYLDRIVANGYTEEDDQSITKVLPGAISIIEARKVPII